MERTDGPAGSGLPEKGNEGRARGVVGSEEGYENPCAWRKVDPFSL